MFATDAPAKIKKNLSSVIELQQSIENITNIIQATRRSLNPRSYAVQTSNILEELEEQQKVLFRNCDELYQTLNLTTDIPDYDGVFMEFMQNLLCARDVKMTVRTLAISSFFEWEKLDQAAGGRHRPLGKCYSEFGRKKCNTFTVCERVEDSSTNSESDYAS